jgi:hypothetical protein
MQNSKRLTIYSIMLLTLCALQSIALPQGRHEKREAKLEESAKPKSVAGGTTFEVDVAYDKAYDTILNYLKKQDYTIDSASKETGQIVTAIVVKGGYSQTGTRVYVTLIKESETKTTIKVAVSEQKRKKLLQTEPWGDPKVNSERSSKLADEVKAALTTAKSG